MGGKMNPELKAKWIAAMESGQYHHHNKGQLQITTPSGPKYCALGVLAEITNTPHNDTICFNRKGLAADYGPLEPLISDNRATAQDAINSIVWTNDNSPDYSKVITWIKENL